MQSVSMQASRRALLVAAAAMAAGQSGLSAAEGPDYVVADPVWQLARRATAGANPEVLAEIGVLGTTAWVNAQLNPGSIPDANFEAFAKRFPARNLSISTLTRRVNKDSRQELQLRQEVQYEHLARLLWSRRQIQALLTDFWANHFNVSVQSTDGIGASRGHYQATIRRLALGKFSDLLVAVTRHPAMLTYLGNRWSTKKHPNENHGRELLELHTVGNGAFSEDDVLACTRVLTGLSVDDSTGEFAWKAEQHWTGPVTVLGWQDENASAAGGTDLSTAMCQSLARNPATARHICTKLAQYFVADDPPAALVERLMGVYDAKDTSIAAVLRYLFSAREFTAGSGPLTRRPMEAVLATVRLLGLKPDLTGYEGVRNLVDAIGDLGQPLLNSSSPDGHPLSPLAWTATSAMVERWNITYGLVDGSWPATLVRPGGGLWEQVHPAPIPTQHGQLLDGISRRIFGQVLRPEDRQAALEFIEVTAQTPITEYSRIRADYLPQLIALLLDSPYHMYR
jgi:uncharacterized protein (DUF1800 family)